MLHIRTHRLELARHRIERDLQRLAIRRSREVRGLAFKPELRYQREAVNDVQLGRRLMRRRVCCGFRPL